MKSLAIVNDRKLYSDWVGDNNNHVPIYYQPFWLDAVCHMGHWDAHIILNQGKIIGIWPLYIRKNTFFAWIDHPPFTPYLGCFIQALNLKPQKRHSLVNHLFNQFSSQFFNYPLIRQHFHPGFHEAMLAHFIGFNLIPKYVQEIILKNQGNEYFQPNSSLADFLESQFQVFRENNFSRKLNHVYKSLLENIHTNATINCFINNGAHLADVHFNGTCYSLGNMRNGKRNGVEELRERSINNAKKENRRYDLRGSSMEGVFEFNQKYNPTVRVYYRGIRTNNKILALIIR